MSSRQLAAILFSDLVGYTELMGKDNKAAMAIVKKAMSLQKPIVEQHNGKWLKEMGDGVLVQFNSALDAVQCAIDIQRMARADLDAQLRIGIHLGDVTIENDDIFGDGVNVASRLETICDPGGIYISESIKKAIAGNNIETTPMDEVELKGVSYPVKPYAIQGTGLPEPDQIPQDLKYGFPTIKKSQIYWTIAFFAIIGMSYWISIQFTQSSDLVGAQIESSIPSDKSLAVLPFTNLSNDPEQEYFSDGLTEDILDQISKVQEIRLISNTSSKAFKETDLTAPEIASKLNVTYLLEGSIRKSRNRVKVVAQLIDTREDKHIWSETFEHELDDIFNTQFVIAKRIASYLNISLTVEEMQDLETAPTNNVEAYDLYLNAKSNFAGNQTEEGFNQSVEMLKQSLKLDPEFVNSMSYLASAYINRNKDDSGKMLLEKALKIDPNNYLPHLVMATYHGAQHNYDEAIKFSIRANQLKRNAANTYLGVAYSAKGQMDSALHYFKRSIPHDPWDIEGYAWVAEIYLSAGLYDSALHYLKKSESDMTNFFQLTQLYQDFYLNAGEYEAGVNYFEKLLASNPGGLSKLFHYQLAINHVFLRNWEQASTALENSFERPTDYHGLVLVNLGDRDSANLIFKKNLKTSKIDDHFRIARLCAITGNSDSAFVELNLAMDDYLKGSDYANLSTLQSNPFFDSLKDAPEFIKVIERFQNHQDSIRRQIE